jgi:hypothetical protein
MPVFSYKFATASSPLKSGGCGFVVSPDQPFKSHSTGQEIISKQDIKSSMAQKQNEHVYIDKPNQLEIQPWEKKIISPAGWPEWIC